jgi:hypothetical protein
MRIRPPVVRKMNQDLWAKMSGSHHPPAAQVPPAQAVQSEIDVLLARLKALGELRASGVLTEDEFLREKTKILG